MRKLSTSLSIVSAFAFGGDVLACEDRVIGPIPASNMLPIGSGNLCHAMGHLKEKPLTPASSNRDAQVRWSTILMTSLYTTSLC